MVLRLLSERAFPERIYPECLLPESLHKHILPERHFPESQFPESVIFPNPNIPHFPRIQETSNSNQKLQYLLCNVTSESHLTINFK